MQDSMFVEDSDPIFPGRHAFYNCASANAFACLIEIPNLQLCCPIKDLGTMLVRF